MKKLKRIASQNLGITALILALAMRFLFWASPSLFEAIYFDKIFPAIRTIQSWIDWLWLVPGYYLLFGIFIAWLIYRRPRKRKFKLFFNRLGNFVGTILALFLFCFGYMYLDKGYAERAGLTDYPDTVDIVSHYVDAMQRTSKIRASLIAAGDTSSIVEIEEIPSIEEIQSWVGSILDAYPAKTVPIKLVQFKPRGTLRRLSISGIYNPFTGEANVDAALPNIQNIYVCAHEMAHAHGITSEAEANFVAYLACLRSGNKMAEYAAEYALWRQIAGEVNKTQPKEIREQLVQQIPIGLQRDRQAIIAAYYAHKAYFPQVTNTLNDTYLRVQGIEAGADDYDGFLKIYLAWLQQQPNS